MKFLERHTRSRAFWAVGRLYGKPGEVWAPSRLPEQEPSIVYMNTQHQTANLSPPSPLPLTFPLARSPSLPPSSTPSEPTPSKPNKTNYKWRPPQLPLLRHVTRR